MGGIGVGFVLGFWELGTVFVCVSVPKTMTPLLRTARLLHYQRHLRNQLRQTRIRYLPTWRRGHGSKRRHGRCRRRHGRRRPLGSLGSLGPILWIHLSSYGGLVKVEYMWRYLLEVLDAAKEVVQVENLRQAVWFQCVRNGLRFSSPLVTFVKLPSSAGSRQTVYFSQRSFITTSSEGCCSTTKTFYDWTAHLRAQLAVVEELGRLDLPTPWTTR